MVLVDYNKFLDEKEEKGYKLFGTQGFCYLEDDFIYKIYYYPRYAHQFSDFTKYKSNMISFPIEYLYNEREHKQVVGEKMIYHPKESILLSINEDVKIDNFVKRYLELIYEIRKFPEIRMNDLSLPNILYNEQSGFTLIDTHDWTINEGYDYFEFNKHRFDFELIIMLLNNLLGIFPSTLDERIFWNNLKKYGLKGRELWKVLSKSLDDEPKLLEVIELYHRLFDDGCYGPIQTIDDMKKYTKKLKKG